MAFDREPFPSEAVQYVTTSHRVRRGRLTTWQPWACGVRRAIHEYRALCHHYVEYSDPRTVHHLIEPDSVGGHAGGIRSGAISFGGSAVCDAVSPCLSGGSLHGSHGLVASAEQSRSTGPSAVVMQHVHVMF